VRVGVISDVHSNLQALEAVLGALSVDELWFLGDLVGYGPRPNECCARLAQTATLALAGNHDLGVLGKVDVDVFNTDGATAIEWTRGRISNASRRSLEGREPAALTEGAELYHASPRDPVWEYVLDDEAVHAALSLTQSPIVLIGHSHVPLAFCIEDGRPAGGIAPAETTVDLGGRRWLLNPGSVGQPRDGDPRAAYLVLDLDLGVATWHRVAYEIDRTQAEIREAGLPETLAARLGHGV
jgi:diadenosine tetraphosphatase ApaH/serine/threonine PP2A family protein phosphatase